MHGVSRKKVSEYGMQLREKQKIRRTYGLMESQFAATFDRASRVRDMPTGEAMLQLLELRLDNVCYRLGFGVSRPQARQLLLHGHITVNGKKVNICLLYTSYLHVQGRDHRPRGPQERRRRRSAGLRLVALG